MVDITYTIGPTAIPCYLHHIDGALANFKTSVSGQIIIIPYMHWDLDGNLFEFRDRYDYDYMMYIYDGDRTVFVAENLTHRCAVTYYVDTSKKPLCTITEL